MILIVLACAVLSGEPFLDTSCISLELDRSNPVRMQYGDSEDLTMLSGNGVLYLNGVETSFSISGHSIGSKSTTETDNLMVMEGNVWQFSLSLQDGSTIVFFTEGTLKQKQAFGDFLFQQVGTVELGSKMFQGAVGRISVQGELHTTDGTAAFIIKAMQGQLCALRSVSIKLGK